MRKYFTEEEKKRATLEKVARYQKKAMTSYCVRFHNASDKLVLDKLNRVENKTDYIRQLILKDIEENEK